MEKWTSAKLREEFLAFFKKQGHKIVPSSSLTNSGDPSVLLTTAGMQQFKPYYLDPAEADSKLGSRRAASSQKCFRTTDIDEVGDETHHTFFEMLGNFAFGDYFKKEAIEFAYSLLTARYSLNLKRLTVTVFGGDSEVPRDETSVAIWNELEFSEKNGNMRFCGREDNFWGPTGEEGPCGPTTEIYVDGVEIWNIVFNEFYCNKDKSLTELANKGIDTGMGLERLAVTMQGVKNNYETDLFLPLLEVLGRYDARENIPLVVRELAGRIIADHMRGSAFLIAEGLEPLNVKAGYVLRRILRRSIRFAHTLNLPHEIFAHLIKTVGIIYKDAYPEILANQKQIMQIFEKEYGLFGKTLKKGMTIFEKTISKIRKDTFPGEEAFFLYTTYGFPLELIEEMAKERGLSLDTDGFDKSLEAHREISKPPHQSR